jgi:hypothetical protein
MQPSRCLREVGAGAVGRHMNAEPPFSSSIVEHSRTVWSREVNVNLEDQKLKEIVDDLARNPRVRGIRLGGSRGLGFADKSSDYDLDLYYSQEAPIDNDVILQNLSLKIDRSKPTRSGRRMNCEMNGLPIEFFYSDTRIVERALAEVAGATFSLRADRWFPQGKISIEPLSYLMNGRLLYDRDGRLTEIRASASAMPKLFQKTLFDFGFVGAETALENMCKAKRLPEHLSHLMAHIFLFVWYSEICLFALNGIYPFSSKQTSTFLSKLPLTPPNHLNIVSEIYASGATGTPEAALQKMLSFLSEVKLRFDRI